VKVPRSVVQPVGLIAVRDVRRFILPCRHQDTDRPEVHPPITDPREDGPMVRPNNVVAAGGYMIVRHFCDVDFPLLIAISRSKSLDLAIFKID
jgi:hypothetical protein